MADVIGRLRILIDAQTAEFSAGIKRADQQITSLGRTMGRIRRTATAFFALFAIRRVGRIMGEAVNSFATFEKGLANIGILLEDEIGRIGEWENAIRSVSKTFGLAAQDLTKAAFDIQSATNDTSLSLAIFTQAAKLAVAGGSDLTSTVSGAITLIEAYGGKFKDVADVMDFLIVAQKKARATIGELSKSSSKFLGVASSLGITVEELFATFAIATRGFGNARDAATGVSAIMNSLQKPSEKMIELSQKQFGMSIQQAVATHGLVEVLKALKTVTIENIGTTLGRMRANRLFGIVKDKVNEIEEAAIELRERAGKVDEKLAIQQKTLQVQLNVLGQVWQDTLRGMGQVFAESKMVEKFAEVALQINRIITSKKGIEALSKIFKSFAQSVGVLLMMLSPLKYFFLGLATVFASVGDGINAIRIAAMEIIASLATQISKALNKILAVTEALKLAGASKKIRELQDTFSIMAEGIQRDSLEIAKSNKSMLEGIVDLFEAYEEGKATAQQALEELNLLLKANEEAADAVVETGINMNLIWNQVSEGISKSIEDMGTINEVVAKEVIDLWTNAFNGIKNSISTVMQAAILEGGKLSTRLKQFWEGIKTSFVKAISDMIANLATWGLQQLLWNKLIMGASIVAAKAIEVAWAGAAAMVSLATFGANAGAAMAGIAATRAFALAGAVGLQHGGIVPGIGRGDKVPAMLEPGELVIPRKDVPSVINNRYNPTVNVSMAGALILDDPNAIEKLYREGLRERIMTDIRTGRDKFYGV